MAATLGAIANKAVTGVGAPSYTSGVHIWNGAAETLNANPDSRNTTPIIIPEDAPFWAILDAISPNWVEPLKP